MSDLKNDESFSPDSYRDHVGTFDEKGKRKYVFPKKPKGKFYDYRKWVSYFLLAFLFSAPFIKVNGNQFLMFNVLERRFNIFGFPFWLRISTSLWFLWLLGWFSLSFLRLFTVEFFADGFARKPFSWKWFSDELNIGLMVTEVHK